jgi:hypothetical protein
MNNIGVLTRQLPIHDPVVSVVLKPSYESADEVFVIKMEAKEYIESFVSLLPEFRLAEWKLTITVPIAYDNGIVKLEMQYFTYNMEKKEWY